MLDRRATPCCPSTLYPPGTEPDTRKVFSSQLVAVEFHLQSYSSGIRDTSPDTANSHKKSFHKLPRSMRYCM